jgi:cytochrome b561
VIRNTAQAYGWVTRSLHWLVALFILGLLCAGFYMTGLESSPFKLKVYGLHKSFGILVLMLVLARLVWRNANPRTGALPGHALWERALARVTHFALYAAMILMPLSGWVMSSAGDFSANFFGLFELPHIVAKNKMIFDLGRGVHEILAQFLLVVVALHMAGAFKHHFIDRDETLQRMTYGRLGLVGGVAIAAIAGAFFFNAAFLYVQGVIDAQQQTIAAQVQDNAVVALPVEVAAEEVGPAVPPWAIDHTQSHLNFEVTQYGHPFKAGFKKFDGQILLDPKDLSQSRADIRIDIASISTGSDERDEQARSAEWFDTSQFPQAHFFAPVIEETAPNQYVAIGTLTIRGVSMPLRLPFTLVMEPGGDKATMTAQPVLRRLDFGIGQGAWQGTEVIGNEVKIDILLHAERF